MNRYLYSFQSEWLKRKRSLASWLVICGAFFTPLIITTAKVIRYKALGATSLLPNYWEGLWKSSWESMAIFLLPLGTILASSLITQLEYKNNSWKLLHVTPQSYHVIFMAKLSVIIVMMLQFLALFNIGIYISGTLPGMLFGLPYPPEPIPYLHFLEENGRYFAACLPIVAIQYLISLQFKNFLVPIGVGLVLWILSVAVLSWPYGHWVPYTYCSFNYLKDQPRFSQQFPLIPFALGYFILITVTAYILYIHQKEKG